MSCIFSVLPGAFQSAVHGIITATNYPAGVQATLRAGGCNASRGGYIGACLGAQVRNYPRCHVRKPVLGVFYSSDTNPLVQS